MPSPSDIIRRAIGRHGGLELWQRLQCVHLTADHLSGLVPWVKGVGRTFGPPGGVRLYLRQRRLIFDDFPTPGRRGIYDNGRVWFDDQPESTADHRTTFRGLRKLRRWQPIDALYFFGYALTTYFSVPFVLPDCEVLDLRRQSGSVPLDGLTVRFPSDWHSHGPVQRFWFDPTGLLIRHDYHAEIVGPAAYGAHFSRDYVEIEGFRVARERRVYLAVGLYPRVAATPVPILHGQLEPVGIEFTTSESRETP